MLSRIHEKLGTAGFVLAVVALIAALAGTAFAAAGLNGKEKKEVKKIAKKFAGKPGARGATGPQGSAGPQGPAGKDGANGKDGTNGTNGTNGQSVIGAPIAKGGACNEQTGVKYTLGTSSTNICNGETGFTETLPSGETETGTWALGPFAKTALVPLTFNIPLAEAPEALHFVNEEGEEKTGEQVDWEPAVNCLGSAEEPTAPAGEVCVYEAINFGAVGFSGSPEIEALFTAGATFNYVIGEGQVAEGTWAVTAK